MVITKAKLVTSHLFYISLFHYSRVIYQSNFCSFTRRSTTRAQWCTLNSKHVIWYPLTGQCKTNHFQVTDNLKHCDVISSDPYISMFQCSLCRKKITTYTKDPVFLIINNSDSRVLLQYNVLHRYTHWLSFWLVTFVFRSCQGYLLCIGPAETLLQAWWPFKSFIPNNNNNNNNNYHAFRNWGTSPLCYITRVLIALDQSVQGVSCVYCETETFVQPGWSVPGPAFTHNNVPALSSDDYPPIY